MSQIHALRRNRLSEFLKAAILSCLALLVLTVAVPSTGQKAENLSRIKTLYVDSLGTSRRSQELRERLQRRLQNSHGIEIVADPAKADALIKGTGQIWTTGEVSLSPHSHSANEAVLEGYLSVEVVGKNDQTLWSYLATPSKFPWGGIADDLARQVSSRLLDDIRKNSQQAEPAVANVTSGSGAMLKGAGATFPAPLYRKWIQSFEEIHPEVHISYEAVGSGEGIRRVSEGEADFGASEMPLSDETMAAAHRRFVQVPIVLGAVVPIYNLPGRHAKIRFTPEILAGIYLGKIKKWNDPQIRSVNADGTLPDANITVVHRSDASGTSFVWTDYLSKVSAEWKSSVGSGVNVTWPLGTGAAYNDGVATAVQQTPNSIGYVELIYAIQHEISYAQVRNSAGQFIKADLASVTEAARMSGAPDLGFRLSITDAPGKSAYPISTYTWLLLPAQLEDKNKQSTLRELVRWMLSAGQKSCSALGYAPLPANVASSGLSLLDRTLSN